jgi:cell division protein FtsN
LAITVTALGLIACLNACSLLDSKSTANASRGQDEQGPASIDQLIDDHEKYEARLQQLEDIILLAGNYQSTVPGNNSLDPAIRAGSVHSAGSLASRPIEPVVIMQPMEAMPAPGKTRVSTAVTPAVQEQPVTAQLPAAPPRPAGNTGNWAINLGSYSSRKVAERMLEKFHRQDIAAELVTAVVNNRTMYRVQIPGFQTRQTAVAHAESLQQRLGVADVWIKKM